MNSSAFQSKSKLNIEELFKRSQTHEHLRNIEAHFLPTVVESSLLGGTKIVQYGSRFIFIKFINIINKIKLIFSFSTLSAYFMLTKNVYKQIINRLSSILEFVVFV